MPTKRVLYSWIGHTDLRAMARRLPAEKRTKILNEIPQVLGNADEDGPIKTLLKAERFDEIHLLSNCSPLCNREFVNWVSGAMTIHPVDLPIPTDYERIFDIQDAALSELRSRADWPNTELCIHLSPGTPAMAANWVLLGKSRYPATFYQTMPGKAWRTHIPLDLTLELAPDVYRAPDVHLQDLTAQSPLEVVGFEEIAGDSKAIRLAVGRARRAAFRGVSVLLLGESGTGKEMFARAIHDASPRRKKPFFAINCAAMSQELLESELFGHVKGAFTGAARNRNGLFAEADGGTLFLDEIGECDVSMQAKLLRVLQPPPGAGPCCRVFRRVGDSENTSSDVRVIAATNKDLLDAIQSRRFRADLYYRLAVITVNLPPLRERRVDIPRIVDRLMAQINQQFEREEPGYSHKSLSDSAMAFVKQHKWPGNVRQLYNALLQASVMSARNLLDRQDIEGSLAEMRIECGVDGAALSHPLGGGFDLEMHLNTIRSHYLRRAMFEARGVKAEAARLLGMGNYQTLAAQLQRLGIAEDWKQIRPTREAVD